MLAATIGDDYFRDEGRGVDRRLRIPLEPVDAVTLTILVENVFDAWMPDQGPAHRSSPHGMRGTMATPTMEEGAVPEGLVAEHGYSLLATVRRGGRTHTVLFDCGTTPDGMVENMRRLSIDPRDVEVVVCSHGHFDHTAGLDGLIRTLGRRGLPVLIHPDFWNRRRVRIPGRDPLEIPTTSRAALEGTGVAVIEERQPSFLLDNTVLITGEVDRTTGYEPGFPIQEALRDGRWEPDPLVLDDQALIINLRGSGLVVVTGCGHAGVVNITRYARALTGIDEVHAIVGGFHLNGPLFEPLIGRVCDDLGAMRPNLVVPGHCTGWRAQHAMGRAFGEAFVPSCVGTTIDLRGLSGGDELG